MDVFLIRHTSIDVPPGTCYGHTDVPLRPTFPEEAARVKQQLDAHTFDAVYTSPLSRCTRLAAYCGYPDALRDDRLKEMNMGAWEMQLFDAITDPRIQEWYDDYLRVAPTGGESYPEMQRRISAFLDELKGTSHQKVALFAHGGVLMCAQVHAGKMLPADALRQLTPYGGIIQITL